MEIVEHVEDVDFFLKVMFKIIKKKWNYVCCNLK